MPKRPINFRTGYSTFVRGSGNVGNADRDMLIKEHEYNTVETELGTMVEPVSLAPLLGGDPFNRVVQNDLTDNAYNAMKVIGEEEFQNTYGTGGGYCVDYNA